MLYTYAMMSPFFKKVGSGHFNRRTDTSFTQLLNGISARTAMGFDLTVREARKQWEVMDLFDASALSIRL